LRRGFCGMAIAQGGRDGKLGAAGGGGGGQCVLRVARMSGETAARKWLGGGQMKITVLAAREGRMVRLPGFDGGGRRDGKSPVVDRRGGD